MNLLHIAYVKSGRLWVADQMDSALIQVDTKERIKETVYSSGPFCVTKNDALLYASSNDEFGTCIKKKTLKKTITLLKTEKMEHVIGIHSSLINGNILILIGIRDATKGSGHDYSFYKITRYDKNGVKIQDIKIDDWGQGLLHWVSACITENMNGDIIISRIGMNAVVGMDRSGGHRFRYSNAENLTPRGICTDKYRHIMVAFSTCIHLLDEDGIFQKILLTNMSTNYFTCLCLDDKQNLYVGNESAIVRVYKYLKDD